DVVSGLRVGQQVVEHVVVARALPEMVVRVDDRQARLQCWLGGLGHPLEIGRDHIAERGRRFCRHGFLQLSSYKTGCSAIIETWAAITFQPTSGKRTQVCICRPVMSRPRTL